MTVTLIVNDNTKLIAEPTANLDAWAGRLAVTQSAPSVYAAYWQARSGFLNLAPKLTQPASTRRGAAVRDRQPLGADDCSGQRPTLE
jgi:hypothetical protein